MMRREREREVEREEKKNQAQSVFLAKTTLILLFSQGMHTKVFSINFCKAMTVEYLWGRRKAPTRWLSRLKEAWLRGIWYTDQTKPTGREFIWLLYQMERSLLLELGSERARKISRKHVERLKTVHQEVCSYTNDFPSLDAWSVFVWCACVDHTIRDTV